MVAPFAPVDADPAQRPPGWVAAVIVVGTSALSVLIHAIYAMLFSSPPMVRLYGKARRVIQCALGAFFTIAGLKLLSSRI